MMLRVLPLFALTLVLATGTAFADYVAGRVRPGEKSEMTTVKASGVYQGVRGALATLNYEDGRADPYSITVTLPGQAPSTLVIYDRKLSACGDVYKARFLTENLAQTSFELTDYSNARCQIYIRKLWNLSVRQSNGNRVLSELDLEGTPETVFVTL